MTLTTFSSHVDMFDFFLVHLHFCWCITWHLHFCWCITWHLHLCRCITWQQSNTQENKIARTWKRLSFLDLIQVLAQPLRKYCNFWQKILAAISTKPRQVTCQENVRSKYSERQCGKLLMIVLTGVIMSFSPMPLYLPGGP